MTKVYLVYGYTPYDGEEVCGVYASQEKAESKAKELQSVKFPFRRWETYEVVEEDVL